jgi:hypothetical protein
MVDAKASNALQTGGRFDGRVVHLQTGSRTLNVSPEAVRQRAMRGRWQRTIGNDKRTRVRLPEDWNDSVQTPYDRPNKRAVPVLDERELMPAKRVIEALEAHVETLKAQLGAAETRVKNLADDFAAREARLAADLAVERNLVDQMSARVDQLAAELAAEQARRGKAEQELAYELARRWWKPQPR